jgi:hypothetical protein
MRTSEAVHVTVGAARVMCSVCSAECWRSTSSPVEVPVICNHCVAHFGPCEIGATDAQLEEASRYLKEHLL